MDRRNFFKILSTVSAGVAASSCGDKSDQLIPLLVPDREIVPGYEQWHPSVCSECSAGCGVIVRVMEGERAIERAGQKFRERIACVKKIEGNPLDPVSGGRLCARGHAALQSLYNPDRLQGPMRRTGARGKAEFTTASWEDAIAAIIEKVNQVRSSDPGKILFLTGSQSGTRSLAIQRFLASLGAPPARACSVADLSVERKAAELVFGWKGLPRYDLAQAQYALGVGADFLGGWASPVYYGRQFGEFRQGRPAVRGRLIQAESRMSITASSADEWLPVRPGFESHFIMAIARVLLDEKLARNREQLPGPVTESIEATDLPALIRASGLEEKRLRRVARDLGESDAPLVIAGASIVQTNSLQALVASHYLNLLLGNIGKPGGVFAPYPEPESAPANSDLAAGLKSARILFLDGENPVYTLPRIDLSSMELIVSFGCFLDDSAAYADFLLPDHHTLESESAVVPAVSPVPAITVTMPFVQPLYNTRPIQQTLAEIAGKMNLPFEPVTPETFVMARLASPTLAIAHHASPNAFPSRDREGAVSPNPNQSWDNIARQGGLWLDEKIESPPVKPSGETLQLTDPVFSGAPEQFPLQFQPYVSLQYHDGRGANLPWMQELPDPASSSMWGLPLEIDPQTAAKLNVRTGDRVRVESEHGSLEAPAYVHPAALPGVVSMAIGEGHSHYGRYASGRGANPLSILAPVLEHSTGALVVGATRVRVARLEDKSGELIQFSPQDREQGPWGYR